MNAQVGDLNRREGVDRARLAAIREREANLSRQVLDANMDGANAAQIARLEAERINLLASIEQLLEVS
jgi:hypothetical protein